MRVVPNWSKIMDSAQILWRLTFLIMSIFLNDYRLLKTLQKKTFNYLKSNIK